MLFITLSLKNNLVYKKNNWVNIPKSSLSVSLVFISQCTLNCGFDNVGISLYLQTFRKQCFLQRKGLSAFVIHYYCYRKLLISSEFTCQGLFWCSVCLHMTFYGKKYLE